MSSCSRILCSVIPLPLRFTGQLGPAHIQSSSVGICGAYSAHSGAVTVCSRSRMERAGSGETDCSGYTVKGQHQSRRNHLHNCPAVIKPQSHLCTLCQNLYTCLCRVLTSLFSVFQSHLLCCILEIQRDVQWAVCPQQWSGAHVLCWCCRWANTIECPGKNMNSYDVLYNLLMK